jgi:hypothetical protein
MKITGRSEAIMAWRTAGNDAGVVDLAHYLPPFFPAFEVLATRRCRR